MDGRRLSARNSTVRGMLVADTRRMLPGMNHVPDDFIDSSSVLHLSENKRTVPSHLPRVPIHHAQVRADGFRQVGFVDDEKVALRDARPAFPRNLVSARNIDHLDGVVREFPAETGREVIPAGFQKKNVRLMKSMQIFQRHQIRGNVFANGRMRTSARLHRANALCRESFVTRQELAVFSCKDVIGNGGNTQPRSQLAAELKHQRRLSAAHRATDSDREGALLEIPIARQLTFMKVTRMIEVLVGMTMIMPVPVTVIVRM